MWNKWQHHLKSHNKKVHKSKRFGHGSKKGHPERSLAYWSVWKEMNGNSSPQKGWVGWLSFENTLPAVGQKRCTQRNLLAKGKTNKKQTKNKKTNQKTNKNCGPRCFFWKHFAIAPPQEQILTLQRLSESARQLRIRPGGSAKSGGFSWGFEL